MVIPFYLFILLTFNFVLGCLGFPICLPMQDMSWDAYSIPVSERSPGGGNGNPLHSSCLDNPMDRTTWQGAIHEAVKSDTTKQLSMQGYLINNVVIISDDQQSDSVIHIHVLVPATHHPRQTPLPSRLPYDIEQNSLCSTVGPCWLSILKIAVCTRLSQTLHLLLPFPYPGPVTMSSLSLWVCFVNKLICIMSFKILHIRDIINIWISLSLSDLVC